MTTLQPPHTALKDGTVILGDFVWPWLLPAVWNEYDEKWAACTVQACPMEPDGKHDTYWETDQEDHGTLAGWMPIPNPPRPPAKSP
jgi:hypothetical protein